MEQITELSEITGKVVVRTGQIENRIFLFFSDNTFIIFKGCGYEERDVDVDTADFDLSTDGNFYLKSRIDDLLSIGVISKDEHKKLYDKYDTEAKERTRLDELNTLGALKKKYESGL